MPQKTIYWRGLSESQLADFQQNQGSSNHCAKYAAATTLNLLYGTQLSGSSLINWLDDSIMKGTGLYTIWGNNNGSLVYQTANLVRKLARQNNFQPEVSCGFGKSADIRERLLDNNLLTMITLTYFQGSEPVISAGENSVSSLAESNIIGGHVMILGAFDPDHQNESGLDTPWGFISSWTSTKYIYWMTEKDFLRTWGKLSFFNMVTVKRRI
jgi:hypothetical protein